ncbi:MAG: N-acetylglucosamine-6-phosphate deacetylase [Eubacteriales bacterium]
MAELLASSEEEKMTVLKNGNIVTPAGAVKGDVVIEGGVIKQIGGTDLPGIDITGKTVLPGFIDTHIHGAFGVEFSSDEGSFDAGLIEEAKQGVTSVCCTVRTLPLEDTYKAIKNIVKEYKRSPKGAKIEGIHLEGPFVSREFSGAMNPAWLSLPNPEEIKKLFDLSEGLLKIITIAPELPGALKSIESAAKLGINVSLGHTGCDYETARAAIEAGANRLTHTFNAMSPFLHRSPGVLGVALTDGRVCCEMICDLVHLHKAAIKLIFAAKGGDNINMVSDSGVFAGLGDGEYTVSGVKRLVKDGVCRNESGRIAGSCFTLRAGVANLIKEGYDINAISKMASANPARALGIDGFKGSLKVGMSASLCVIDSAGEVLFSMAEGVRYA